MKLNDEVDYQLGEYGVAENEGSRRELEKIQDPEDLQDFNVPHGAARGRGYLQPCRGSARTAVFV